MGLFAKIFKRKSNDENKVGGMEDFMTLVRVYFQSALAIRLVITNLADNTTMVNVNIPAHAFDYLKLKEKNAIAIDLLTKEKLAVRLKKDSAVRMSVGARTGRVWKVKL